MISIVQIVHPVHGRRVALVREPKVHLFLDCTSAYALASLALKRGEALEAAALGQVGSESLDYNSIYEGRSEWRLLPPFDHPGEPSRCLVTGTGLTHSSSAKNRAAMHPDPHTPASESLRMYQWGVEGGRPAPGQIGAQPEWFYKGCATILRAPGEPLEVPTFALDGGEEPEVAGVYLIAPDGQPRRVGLVLANEFSDHVLESHSHLYIAHSKLRTCSIGPELIVGGDFIEALGTVTIEREGKPFWSKPFGTGEKNMCHSLANLEHHHFKYSAHRRPGDAHIHFLGTSAFSYGEGIKLLENDVMVVQLPGFGRPLRNPLHIEKSPPEFVSVPPL